MFKVLCIKAAGNLSFMETYTVVEVIPCNLGTGRKGYALEEIQPPVPTCDCYDTELFIPLDGPCEVEILEARVEEEIVRLDLEFSEIVQTA